LETHFCVAGLGITGQSVLRFLANQGDACYAFDTREDFDLSELSDTYQNADFATGELPLSWLDKIHTLVLSPGIGKSESWVQKLIQRGISVIGDIELFSRLVDVPVVAITGSNGKSTVTTLVMEVLSAAGYRVGMGGNIGQPVLDLILDAHDYDVYVLELSSFQLETTYSLKAKSAAILNISEDHMDRYAGLEDYIQAKLGILDGAELQVMPLSLANRVDFSSHQNVVWFDDETIQSNASKPALLQVQTSNGSHVITLDQALILSLDKMKLQGFHHRLNAMAVLGLCLPFELDKGVFESVFESFSGLAHRTQQVAEIDGVHWINDSKGTNVGATVTAIQTFFPQAKAAGGKLVLIAGGVSKDADFTELADSIETHQVTTLLFGRDADIMQLAIGRSAEKMEFLAQAIDRAKAMTSSGDIVLFSPACASFDQFNHYVHRGEVFEALVKKLENLSSGVVSKQIEGLA
jgi:UDP-N-acetylmuramoylalanine--D-glutamate ligase